MRHHVTAIDDFYEDPLGVRTLALGLDFTQKPGATYPGLEAVCLSFDWASPWRALASFIQSDVEPNGKKTPAFPQGKFRIAMQHDQWRRIDGVHVDEQPWSGVVYLTPREGDSRIDAVSFYRHNETGLTTATPEWWAYISLKLEFAYVPDEERRNRFWAYMRNERHWTEIDRMENRFNRALLLNAKQFHASVGLFGESISTGRLTQHFEFYDPGIFSDATSPNSQGRLA